MAAFQRTPMRNAWLATLVAAALVWDVAPSSAAEIVGTPKNNPSAAVQIVSCSVTIDSKPPCRADGKHSPGQPDGEESENAMTQEPGDRKKPGAGDDTRVFAVPVEKSNVPLDRYPVNGNYVGLGCHLRTVTFADGSVQSIAATTGGGSSSGATLGILGGLVLVGGIAAAAGHGGGSSGGSNPTPLPTPTMIPITPSATPTPLPSATPKPSPTPLPTAVPTATPVPTASPTPPPGALVVNPQSLTFIATGTAYAKTSQASESNYSGVFKSSPTTCMDSNGTSTMVASISPPTTTSGLFTITPLAAGACTFFVTDANGFQQTISVGVSTTGGTVMSRGANRKGRPSTVPTPAPSASPTPTPRPAGRR